MDSFTRQTVLVVDDVPENIMILDGILRGEYNVRAATSGKRALEVARSDMPPDIILLDVMMPDTDGFEVCSLLKASPATSQIPVIFVTAMGEVEDEERGFTVGAVDYIHKPISPGIVRSRVRTHLALYDQNRELERRVRERTRELQQTRLQIIQRLGRAGEFRDNETGMHVIRVSHYCRLIGQAIGMNESDVEMLFDASPMHDIGKIGIHDDVLLKAGRLTIDERDVMRTHPAIGGEIIGEHNVGLLAMAHTIAMTHHEKWDGTGYPNGLKGEEIPLEGRIVAIADVFDALTSERPYKTAWTVSQAVEFIESEAGTHFDPCLVQKFKEVLPEILKCREAYSGE